MSEIKLFPGTTIKTTFMNSPSYAPVFMHQHQNGLVMGSVNAGNSDGFFVLNSGGINMSFDRAFQAAGQYNYMGPDPYVTIHKDLFDAAKSGSAMRTDFTPKDPLSYAMVYRPIPSNLFQGFKGNDGTVFLDVFKGSLVPKQNQNNYAMIYVCPPNGPSYQCDDDFLAAIEETAKNLVRAVRLYNTYALTESSVKNLETVRMCLYSSGLFNRAGVSIDSIAVQVFKGLEAELRLDIAGIIHLEFENGLDPKNNKRPFEAIATLSSQWQDPS
jgi:hypothetical protein